MMLKIGISQTILVQIRGVRLYQLLDGYRLIGSEIIGKVAGHNGPWPVAIRTQHLIRGGVIDLIMRLSVFPRAYLNRTSVLFLQQEVCQFLFNIDLLNRNTAQIGQIISSICRDTLIYSVNTVMIGQHRISIAAVRCGIADLNGYGSPVHIMNGHLRIRLRQSIVGQLHLCLILSHSAYLHQRRTNGRQTVNHGRRQLPVFMILQIPALLGLLITAGILRLRQLGYQRIFRAFILHIDRGNLRLVPLQQILTVCTDRRRGLFRRVSPRHYAVLLQYCDHKPHRDQQYQDTGKDCQLLAFTHRCFLRDQTTSPATTSASGIATTNTMLQPTLLA